MEQNDIHPGSHLSDIDITIELVSGQTGLQELQKITTALKAIVTNLAPEVVLVERETKVVDTAEKTLRKIRLKFQI